MTKLALCLLILLVLVVIWYLQPASYPDISGNWQGSLQGLSLVQITKIADKQFTMQAGKLVSRVVFNTPSTGYIYTPDSQDGSYSSTKFVYQSYPESLIINSVHMVPGAGLQVVTYNLERIPDTPIIPKSMKN
jgi:hypothetical protein